MKKIKTDAVAYHSALVFILLVSGFFSAALPASAATPAPTTKPYQAIVKINTYYLDEYNNVAEYGSGSGIIIDPSGLVLTNYHVTSMEEDFDNSLRDTSYQVCLTVDPNAEPDCSHLGQMVARDKDLDVAILKLVPMGAAASVNPLPYLKLDGSNKIAASDKVTILGYPGIGSETITTTEGIISGKINKYKEDWLKTDAVISFGNSGGAAVSKSGSVVGLVSQAHSDLLGTLGYLINISSLTNWIADNSKKSVQPASFEARLIDFTAKQKEMKKSGDMFQNAKPQYSVVKPSDWNFLYSDENKLTITKNADDTSGVVQITATPYSVKASTDMGITVYKQKFTEAGGLGLVKFTKNEPITTANGLAGSKITLTFAGKSRIKYFFAIDNYLLEVAYDYGKSDKDKNLVEGVIDSLRQTGTTPFEKKFSYESAGPAMSLVSADEWAVQSLNSKTKRAELYNEKYPNADISLEVKKLSAEEKDATNEERLQLMKDALAVANNTGSITGTNYEISDSSAHYALNDEISDAIMTVIKISKPGADGLLAVSADYIYKVGGNTVDMSFNMFTDKQSDFDAVFAQVKPILASLSLKTLAERPQKQEAPPIVPPVETTPPQEATTTPEQATSSPSVAAVHEAPAPAPIPAPAPEAAQEATSGGIMDNKIVFWSVIGAWGLAVLLVLFFLVRRFF